MKLRFTPRAVESIAAIADDIRLHNPACVTVIPTWKSAIKGQQDCSRRKRTPAASPLSLRKADRLSWTLCGRGGTFRTETSSPRFPAHF